MKLPSFGLCAAVLLVLASAAPASAQGAAPRTAGGCPLDPVKFHECALPKTKTFNPPRTPDGRPDMQGYWERAFTSQDVEEHGADGLNIQPGPSLVIDTPDHKIPYQHGRSSSGRGSSTDSSRRWRAAFHQAFRGTSWHRRHTRSSRRPVT